MANSSPTWKATNLPRSSLPICSRQFWIPPGIETTEAQFARRTTYSTRAGAELEYRHAVELLPWFQLSRGKAGAVGRVREMLGFEAKCESPVVNAAFFSGDRSVEEVSRVELQSWFSREHLQNPASGRLIHFGRLRQMAWRMIQHEVVVVPLAEAQLGVVHIDPLSEGMRGSKIEWSARH